MNNEQKQEQEIALITENEYLYKVIDNGRKRMLNNQPLRIMIFGFGSAAKYLFDYLTTYAYQIEVIICTRNVESAAGYVNCIRMAGSMRICNEILHTTIIPCDINDIVGVSQILEKWKPEIVVNTSRYWPGVKYGSKSWSQIRAYGFWSPISAVFPIKIAEAIKMSEIDTIFINTSYPDAVNRLIVENGFKQTIFGAGNVNHIIPRFKNAMVKLWNAQDNGRELHSCEFEIAIATSHYHDVLIGKEGDDERCPILVTCIGISKEMQTTIPEVNAWIQANYDLLLKECVVPFPGDATRNMMVASSCVQIIDKIIYAINGQEMNTVVCIPGAFGNVGGYPVEFTVTSDNSVVVEISDVFAYSDMYKINMASIKGDGIDYVDKSIHFLTSDKFKKFCDTYVEIPEEVPYNKCEEYAKTVATVVFGDAK